jgi:hypothetical protein
MPSSERYRHYLIGAITAGIAAGLLGYFKLYARLNDLVAQGVTITAIAIGFLATVISVLMTIPGNRAVKLFLKTERWQEFCGLIRDAIIWCAIACILSALLMLHDFTNGGGTSLAFGILWASVIGLAFGQTLTVLEIFYEVIKRGPG